MRYHFKVHKEKKKFWAYCLEADGWTTQANSREELDRNMREVLEGILDEPESSKWIPPMPDPSLKGKNVVEVTVEPGIALATLVRVSRVRQGMTQRQAAEKLGLRNVIQYQRLESGGTANPELKTLAKLKRLFPDFSVDAALA